MYHISMDQYAETSVAQTLSTSLPDCQVATHLVVNVVLRSIHYQRIHPEYWRDRLLRVKAMGLNAIQVRSQLTGRTLQRRALPNAIQIDLEPELAESGCLQWYVTWNLHEPKPGVHKWDGFADVERFLEIANELDLMVFFRPGPYACGEWEFGGFPYWLASDTVSSGCLSSHFQLTLPQLRKNPGIAVERRRRLRLH